MNQKNQTNGYKASKKQPNKRRILIGTLIGACLLGGGIGIGYVIHTSNNQNSNVTLNYDIKFGNDNTNDYDFEYEENYAKISVPLSTTLDDTYSIQWRLINVDTALKQHISINNNILNISPGVLEGQYAFTVEAKPFKEGYYYNTQESEQTLTIEEHMQTYKTDLTDWPGVVAEGERLEPDTTINGADFILNSIDPLVTDGDFVVPRYVGNQDGTYKVYQVKTFAGHTGLTPPVFAGSITFNSTVVGGTPETSSVIGNGFFTNNNSSLIFSKYVRTICESAFETTSTSSLANNVKTLNLGQNITTIGDNAFKGLLNVDNEITIPPLITNLTQGVFLDCEKVPKFNLPSNLEIIENNVFEHCFSWTGDLIIPNKTITIGDFAFLDTYNLHSITIGERTNVIGECAFKNSGSEFANATNHLQVKVYWNNMTNKSVGNEAFNFGDYSAFVDVHLPKDSTVTKTDLKLSDDVNLIKDL